MRLAPLLALPAALLLACPVAVEPIDEEACELIADDGSPTVVAVEDVADVGDASLAVEEVVTVELPASGVGHVQVENDDHQDVVLYLGPNGTFTSVTREGSGELLPGALSANPACSAELPSRAQIHFEPGAHVLTIEGAADASVILVALSAGHGH